MTTYCTPSSTIWARRRCRSRDSGVVRSASTAWLPNRIWMVPINPTQAGLLQNGFHEIGCGGLAVGARHPHNPQSAGWVLVEVGRGNPQGIAGIVHHNLSQVEVGNRPFHQNASGAPFPGLMDKIVAIELLPHHGHEEISRFYPARIIADAAKARCFSVYLVFQSVQYRIQLHWPSPSTKAQTALPPMNLWEPASRRWAPAARLLRCPPL